MYALVHESAQLLARFIALMPVHPSTNNANQVTVFVQDFLCQKLPHVHD